MSHSVIINGTPVAYDVTERRGDSICFMLEGMPYRFSGQRQADGSFILRREMPDGSWQAFHGYAGSAARAGTHVQLGFVEAIVSQQQQAASAGSGTTRLSPLAPMPGVVRQVLVAAGDKVTSGQPLIVLEAMKLQLTLSAGGDAVVEALLVSQGQMVGEGAELVKLAPVD